MYLLYDKNHSYCLLFYFFWWSEVLQKLTLDEWTFTTKRTFSYKTILLSPFSNEIFSLQNTENPRAACKPSNCFPHSACPDQHHPLFLPQFRPQVDAPVLTRWIRPFLISTCVSRFFFAPSLAITTPSSSNILKTFDRNVDHQLSTHFLQPQLSSPSY